MKDEIIKLYLQNKSLTKTAKHFGMSRKSVTKIIKDNNIEIVNYQNLSKLNENYFSKIDCENKAYWLGFIYADGCISNGVFEIGLMEADIKHLEKFKKDIQFIGDIKYKKNTKSIRIAFRNKIFIENLKKCGLTERKSLNVIFPKDIIPKELVKDFVRGYVDGNGSIIERNRNNKLRYSLAIASGNKKFLMDLIEAANFTTATIYKDNRSSTYSCEYRNNHIEYLDYLYKDSKIYLDRKYEKYLLAKACAV